MQQIYPLQMEQRVEIMAEAYNGRSGWQAQRGGAPALTRACGSLLLLVPALLGPRGGRGRQSWEISVLFCECDGGGAALPFASQFLAFLLRGFDGGTIPADSIIPKLST